MNNNSMDKKYIDLINDNGNVSESSDVKEFFTVVGIILALLFSLFWTSDYIAKIYIDRMSNETQIKIEKLLSQDFKQKTNPKYNSKLKSIESIKSRIITHDENIQQKSNFPIYVYPSPEVNAFVTVDGSIYFTEGLLEEVKNDNELAFILAHEMGHYAHRDHLKSMSRQIIAVTVISALSLGQSSHFSNFASSMNDISNIKYSQEQEIEADSYANKVSQELYGTNKGGIDFFQRIKEKEKMPQFVNYFSSHPSPDTRIKLLLKRNN